MTRLPLSRWRVLAGSCEAGRSLGQPLGLSPITGTVLLNRGIESSEDARQFLSGPLTDLHDPFLLRGMATAVDRLAKAVTDGEKILIYGDYDVDGVTGAALMTRVLRGLGANVDTYLPHRVRDGYGVSAHAFEQATDKGTQLIVTTDCGIGAVEEVELAATKGVDVIVTDHHEPPAVLPNAVAILNPKLRDSGYPFPELAGVGVAFKLMCALARQVGKSEAALHHHFLDLVAMGTIADVVPLRNENRLIARAGLQLIPKTSKAGLRALLKIAALDSRPITAYHVGFALGPRLNAAGRLDHARAALELLLTSDEARAAELAQQLDATNRERQQIEKDTLAQALEMVRDKVDLSKDRGIVLGSTDWHEGVVGIVASRLVDRYHRPTILLALRDEVSKGSGRSIPGFSLVEGIGACASWLKGFGGHEQAAGITILPAKLEGFRAAFLAVCAHHLTDDDMVSETEIECLVPGTDLTTRLAKELEQLAPFGLGNKRPVFAFEKGVVARSRGVGREGEHLSLTVKVDDRAVDCMWWRRGYLADEMKQGTRLDACFTIGTNTFGGLERVRLTLEDVRKLPGAPTA